MNEPIAKLVPTKPDAELAAELRKRAIDLYEPICELLTQAHAAGFEVQIACGMGPLGRCVITGLKVVKVY